jgi:hypothetical protein
MNKKQEKRLLLLALKTLRHERSTADTIDAQLDLTDRIGNIQYCLETLNWSEVNMRQRTIPSFWRLYTRWPADRHYKPTDWKNGKQVKNLIYATIFTEREKELVESELNNQAEKNFGLTWEWRKCT